MVYETKPISTYFKHEDGLWLWVYHSTSIRWDTNVTQHDIPVSGNIGMVYEASWNIVFHNDI